MNTLWLQQTFLNLSLYFLPIAVFFKRIDYFSLFQKHLFISELSFKMSFHFRNVVLFQNVLSFSKCVFIFNMCFHFQNMLSFSKCAFIFKMCFHFQNVLSLLNCALIFKMCFHLQNVLSFSKYFSRSKQFIL
jgi:hypothetical protein